MEKLRLDELLVKLGLCESKSKANSLIMSGNVIVNGEVLTKPGKKYSLSSKIEIKEAFPYVSRGALKLKKAIEEFKPSIKDKVCIDIGCSTGGFTQVLLENGARKVYAVDVGVTLDYKLRNDPRVFVMEKVNARYLKKDMFTDRIEFATVDVSFISLRYILPVIRLLSIPFAVLLIKPQFEVGDMIKGFDGVVRDDGFRMMAIDKVVGYALENGYERLGLVESPIKGPKGNVEYLLYIKTKD